VDHSLAQEIAMVSLVGLLSVTGGGVVAYAAERFPVHVETIETAAGVLLLGGFALIGCALPAMI
jgi:hypothetical protein